MADNEVVKHTAAIHISNTISFLQRKISNVLLKNAWNDLTEKETHRIEITDLTRAVGFDSKNEAALKEAIKALNRIQIEWNLLNRDKKNQWGVSTILASAQIQNGVCEYSYSVHLRNILRYPNIFARLNLLIQRTFSSKHSLALWEYLLGELAFLKGDQKCATSWIAINELQVILGVQKKSYEQFKIFNRAVLTPAVREINQHSEIEIFEIERKKKGRRITSLRFIVQRKPSYQTPFNFVLPASISGKTTKLGSVEKLSGEKELAFIESVGRYHIDKATAQHAITTHGLQGAIEIRDYALEGAKQRQGTDRQIQSIGAYMAKCFKHGYGKKTLQERQEIEEQKKTETIEKRKSELEKIIDDIKTAANRDRIKRIDEIRKKLPMEDERTLKKEFANQIKAGKHGDFFAKGFSFKGWKLPGVQALFTAFLVNKLLPPNTDSYRVVAKSKGYDYDDLLAELEALLSS